MKTVRFSKIVDQAGKPRMHLQLMAPADDRVLQQAIRANRVMTVHQSGRGNMADFGRVGYEERGSGQIFVFPKSLGSFAGKKVVGIKYDLLREEEVAAPRAAPKKAAPKGADPKNAAPKRAAPKKQTRRPPTGASPPARKQAERKDAIPSPPSNVVRMVEIDPEADGIGGASQLKCEMQRVLEDLEQGRQVAAYNRLKRLMHTL